MRIKLVLIVLVVCAGNAVPAHLRAQNQPTPQTPAQANRFRVTPLTTHGLVRMADLAPAVSPDGRWIAYTRFEQPGPNVRSEIWLLDRESGRDEILLPRTHVEYWGMDFAPDGRAVYTTRSLPPFNTGTLIRIRLADRQVEEVRSQAGREPVISPNGRLVAFNRRMSDPVGRELVVAPLDGGPERILARRARPEALNYPTWRSDGEAILFRALDAGHATALMEVSLSDGSERVMAKPTGWGNASATAWLPGGRSFLVTANQGSELWRVSYPSGALDRLGLNRPDMVHGLTSAAAARLVVAQRTRTEAMLWLAARDSAGHGTERPWPHLFAQPIWTEDGKLLYLQSASRGADVVVIETDGRELRKAPLAVPSPQYPRLSRNGAVLLVSSYAVGDRAFWRSGPNGEGPPAKVTSGPSDFMGADVSPDGKWIAYATWASGRFAIWRADFSGGPPTRLIGEEAILPAISPDGKWVAAYHRAASSDPDRIVIVPATGGDPVILGGLPLTDVGLRWTPDGNALSFKCALKGIQNICVVPKAGGPVRQITAFSDGEVASHDWSPSGQLLVVRTRTLTDLVVINVSDND
jgi:Tol biopolymer transport system component